MADKKIKFYVFNIKLQTEKIGQERTQAYDYLFKSLIADSRFTRLNKNEAITMYKPFERTEKEIKYYYGAIGKGISFFDKEEIIVSDNNKISKEPVNKNRILEPISGDYIFIPAIHRFALIQKPNTVTLYDFNKFLQEHLQKFVELPDKLLIDFEKESSIIEEIFKARAIYSLSYEISYTNCDALSAQGELFDELLKENHIGDLKVVARSDHNSQGMNIEKVDFLGGGIEVAKKNGSIRQATILPDDDDKIKKISNTNKPMVQEFILQDDNDNLNLRWFQSLLNIYKSK